MPLWRVRIRRQEGLIQQDGFPAPRILTSDSTRRSCGCSFCIYHNKLHVSPMPLLKTDNGFDPFSNHTTVRRQEV